MGPRWIQSPEAWEQNFVEIFQGTKRMLYYALVFLLIALVAGVLGFGGLAVGAASIAKVLFVVFLVGALISFVMHGRSRI
jgi:uncharacterized membrane protein YtjA (UPF0391 family)